MTRELLKKFAAAYRAFQERQSVQFSAVQSMCAVALKWQHFHSFGPPYAPATLWMQDYDEAVNVTHLNFATDDEFPEIWLKMLSIRFSTAVLAFVCLPIYPNHKSVHFAALATVEIAPLPAASHGMPGFWHMTGHCGLVDQTFLNPRMTLPLQKSFSCLWFKSLVCRCTVFFILFCSKRNIIICSSLTE